MTITSTQLDSTSILDNHKPQDSYNCAKDGQDDTVSTQFLRLQISTFDKSSIPTLAHSRMELLHSPSPCILTPPSHDLTIKTNKDKNTKTALDIPEWFSGNHDKLLVLQ